MNITLYNDDCLNVMKNMDDNSIDLIVTSPPYWNLRDYSYWSTYDIYMQSVNQWIEACARVIKNGRYICWNIQHFLPDKLDGARYHRPLSADTIAIAYKHNLMLNHCVIWHKPNGRNQRMFGSYPYPPNLIYTPNYEDILIFRKNGKSNLSGKNDESKLTEDEWAELTLPIWTIPIDYRKMGHNAIFPEELPRRCIKLHSFVGDTVLDPFMGSGTTGVSCIELRRKFIGIDSSSEYFQIAQRRLNNHDTVYMQAMLQAPAQA